MNISFNKKMNKVLVGAIVLTVLATSATPVFASIVVAKTEVRNAKAVNISDIQGHWGEKFIKDLINKGAINGYPDGTFKPNKTISFAEFLSISVRSVAGNDVKASPENTHWSTGVYQTAIEKGIITPQEFKGTAESFNAPISREDMALILVRLNENIQGESKMNASTMKNKIEDYNSISAKRTYYVEQAYKKGLLGGKGNGFDPSGKLTRAEASTAVCNLLNTNRKIVPDAPAVEKPARGHHSEISLTNPSRPLQPKAGDVVINPKGDKVTLKVGPSGVLGEGQGVNYYEGIKFKNGHVFKNGDIGVPSQGHAGETYLVDNGTKLTDGTGEGHFQLEWHKISKTLRENVEKDVPNPKNGQVYKNWLYHQDGMWYWCGPMATQNY